MLNFFAPQKSNYILLLQVMKNNLEEPLSDHNFTIFWTVLLKQYISSVLRRRKDAYSETLIHLLPTFKT